MPQHDDIEIAALFKALAHPARIQLARFLSSQETCFFGSLADRLPQARSTVSQHITQMKDGGLIKAPESGDRGCYCLDREAVTRLKAFVASLQRARSYGRAPTFLLATGYEQVRSIAAALDGDLAAAHDLQLDLPQTGVCSSQPVAQGAAVSVCCAPVREAVPASTACYPAPRALTSEVD